MKSATGYQVPGLFDESATGYQVPGLFDDLEDVDNLQGWWRFDEECNFTAA